MTYAKQILPEFDREMASTRIVLETIPNDKLAWKAHAKSNTIGWNANHLAEMPGWMTSIFDDSFLDVAPANGPRYESPKLTNTSEIVALFDKNVAMARKAIEAAKDEKMGDMWSLMAGGKSLFTMPRSAVIRTFVLNHMIHHRAILCVYLRLNDVPVPGMYGPSGDDQPV
ncbi:MAG: DinB family protein [Pirellulales bacterium]|nr:DinB family protein [Pirellulales bacterium]